ncbi:MAG: alpha-L-fucosidase [Pontiellaceae bacterium]|nr:alpha-L-fucosidase [Pontiellaceae bacterium]
MKKNKVSSILPLVLVCVQLFSTAGVSAQNTMPLIVETEEQHDRRMAWWRDAKFGMFVHWGLYAKAAGTWNGEAPAKDRDQRGEWIQNAMNIPAADYAALAETFNPVEFDAEKFVELALESGFKYIVITAKHHEGFAMYHSKASPFNICDATPFKRDPLKELADACQKKGMKLGIYYSQAQDWHHAGGACQEGGWDPKQAGDMDEYLKIIAVPQVKELLTEYGPIAELWFDTPAKMTQPRADLFKPLLDLQPGIIVNNRLGGSYNGDINTPEGHIPATGYPNRDWETCMPMNNTWGYKKDEPSYRSAETLIRNLIDIASKGGNYLLNVSPTDQGAIPPEQIERLKVIGAWLKVNGEAIYGTKPTIFGAESGAYTTDERDKNGAPVFKTDWKWRCTTGRNRIYLHLFTWPQGTFTLNDVPNVITNACLLADPARMPLPVEQQGGTVVISLPETAPDAIASVVVLETGGDVVRPVFENLSQTAEGSLELGAEFAALLNGGDQAPALKFEGSKTGITSWTRPGDYAEWNAKIKMPGKFRVFLTYSRGVSENSAGFLFSAGNETLSGTLEPTEGWGRYKSADVGTLLIPEAGTVTISLKPVDLNKTFCNLRSVMLIPEKE